MTIFDTNNGEWNKLRSSAESLNKRKSQNNLNAGPFTYSIMCSMLKLNLWEQIFKKTSRLIATIWKRKTIVQKAGTMWAILTTNICTVHWLVNEYVGWIVDQVVAHQLNRSLKSGVLTHNMLIRQCWRKLDRLHLLYSYALWALLVWGKKLRGIWIW